MPIKVRYGIPKPTLHWDRSRMPEFKEEHRNGQAGIRLNDFPQGILPSGGMSDVISPSEMYMVSTCVPTRHTWKDNNGKVLSDQHNANYSFIGRFPWEIQEKGMYIVEIRHKGMLKGFVEFEVT